MDGLRRRDVLGAAAVTPLAACALATEADAAPVAVGLVCVSLGAPPEKDIHFHIDFDLPKGRWTEGENGSTSTVFRTKSGPYVVKPEGTYLTSDGRQTVGLLQAFAPGTAKDGDHRTDGKAMETGRIFDWTVAIITN